MFRASVPLLAVIAALSPSALAAADQAGVVRYVFRNPISEATGGAERVPATAAATAPAAGALFDGGADGSGARVGWKGSAKAPGREGVVFDLGQPRRLSAVEVVVKAPNRFWGIKGAELQWRAQDGAAFRVAGCQEWREGAPLRFVLDGSEVRWLRLWLVRAHSFVNLPLDEVRLIAADGAVLPVVGQPADDPELAGEFARDALLLDRFGQALDGSWPGKITEEEQLTAAAGAEAERHAATPPPARAGLDLFGGWTDLPAGSATGFFRLVQQDGRWWFATPLGNRFLVMGVDAASWREWGYATPLKHPDGRSRQAFVELPPRERFPLAYPDDGQVSFLVANLQRKYGPDFPARWSAVNARRLQDWGFNTHSKWAADAGIRLPCITVLRPSREARRIRHAIDPFDPGFPAALDAGLAGRLATMRNDPWIVGHTFENEVGWDGEVVAELLRSGSDCAAKRAYLEFLSARSGGDLAKLRARFGVAEGDLDVLLAQPLALKDAGEEMRDFVRQASHRYHSLVAAAIRRHDPNHLYLGGSLTPRWRNSTEWEVGSLASVDALSIDTYGRGPGWIRDYEFLGKPVLLLEFSFSVPGRGLSALNNATRAADHRERGLLYRRMVENLFASPCMVGTGWFLYYDQSAGHRSLPDGENFNMGLIDQTDQPYEEMTEQVALTHSRVREIHSGHLAPIPAE